MTNSDKLFFTNLQVKYLNKKLDLAKIDDFTIGGLLLAVSHGNEEMLRQAVKKLVYSKLVIECETFPRDFSEERVQDKVDELFAAWYTKEKV